MDSSVEILTIIIARLTSSRLPKKHLREIGGKPLIYRTLERIKCVNEIDKVVLATGPIEENSELADYLKNFDIETFFDDNVNDVVGRITKVINKYPCKHIVTISGDCPLIDPEFISEGINLLINQKTDFVDVDKSKYKCAHEGIEFFSSDYWQKVNKLSNELEYREHPSLMLRLDKTNANVSEIIPEKKFRRNDLRLSVDTLSDLDFMNEVYMRIGFDKLISLTHVVDLVDKYPEIKNINNNVCQRSVDQQSKSYLIITQANSEIGMGHLSRCLVIARKLKEEYGANVVFQIEPNETTERILEQQGMQFRNNIDFKDIENFVKQIKILPNLVNFEGVIIDLIDKYQERLKDLLPKLETKITLIDTIIENCSDNIISIIPSLTLSNFSANSKVYAGKDYFLLKEELSGYNSNIAEKEFDILILTGGSTIPQKDFLKQFIELQHRYKIIFILGPFTDKEKYMNLLDEMGLHKVQKVFAPNNLNEIYKKTKLALSIYGVSVFELLSMGVPTIVYKVSKEDDESLVQVLEQKRVCINAVKMSENGLLQDLIESTLNDNELKKLLSVRSSEYIDCLGGSRVAKIIDQHSV